MRRHAVSLVGALLIACSGEAPRVLDARVVVPVEPDGAARIPDGRSPPEAGRDLPSSPSCEVVIEDVSVIPMKSEGVLEHQRVCVNGKQIAQVVPASGSPPPSPRVIDGKGKYLLPGLADLHIHFDYEQESVLYVANGVTSVRIMWGYPSHLTLKKQIEAGQAVGPELHVASPIIDGNPPTWYGSVVVNDARQGEDAVLKQVTNGYEFIKIYDGLNAAAFNAIIATAAQQKIPVVGHVPNAVGLTGALNAGMKSIEHLDGYNVYVAGDSEAKLTVQKGVWNCATLVVYEKYNKVNQLKTQNIPELKYLHPSIVKGWMSAYPWPQPLDKYQAKLKQLSDLGAGIMAGTDALNPFVIPGFAIHEELALMVQGGLTPYAALRSSTVGAATFLGTTNRSGTIEAGKDADLVLLVGNPLQDIAHTRSPAGVMVKGRYYSRAELDAMLADVAKQYK